MLSLDLNLHIHKCGLLDGRGFVLMGQSHSDAPGKIQISEKVTESIQVLVIRSPFLKYSVHVFFSLSQRAAGAS